MKMKGALGRALGRISKIWMPASKKEVVHAFINNYHILVLANEDVGRSILFGKSYEPAETRVLQKFIAESSTCIDIGANVGYFSLLMGSRCRQGKVYAFEPIPLNSSLLRASIELNRFDNIEIVEYAVGNSDSVVLFSQSTDSAYSSIIDTERKPVERSIQVPMTMLDTFLSDKCISSVDILKIDVEGAEGLVVEGARSLLGDCHRRPRLVLMELYDPNLSAFGTRALEIVDSMRELGYVPFFANEKSELVPFHESGLSQMYNVFFLAGRAPE
jgi:FkbM family methyltransferase